MRVAIKPFILGIHPGLSALRRGMCVRVTQKLPRSCRFQCQTSLQEPLGGRFGANGTGMRRLANQTSRRGVLGGEPMHMSGTGRPRWQKPDGNDTKTESMRRKGIPKLAYAPSASHEARETLAPACHLSHQANQHQQVKKRAQKQMSPRDVSRGDIRWGITANIGRRHTAYGLRDASHGLTRYSAFSHGLTHSRDWPSRRGRHRNSGSGQRRHSAVTAITAWSGRSG